MRRLISRLRGTRVSPVGLALVSVVSAGVSALIVVSALGQTGPERAVIAALRTNQVLHASAPASAAGSAGGSAASASAAAPAANPAPAEAGAADVAPASDPGGAAGSSEASAAADSSDTSDASDSSAGSDSADSSGSAGASSDSNPKQPSGPTAKVKHVFVIVLSTPSYQAAFGSGSKARYLNSTLRGKGELLSQYRTLGSAQLPDYLAMVSGQAPNRDTTQGCSTYGEFPSSAAAAKNGLVPGRGCVYPNTALTIGDQLDSANLPWRGYIGGMTGACQHPDSGAADDSGTSQYATAHNPFVYFHSLLDLGDCQSDDVPFGHLAAALRATGRTPSYSFISPDLCDSGAGATCPDGQTAGIAASDKFLQQTVPGILKSAAYRAGGALMIVFTTAPPGAVAPGTGSPPTSTTSTSTTSTATTSTPSTTPTTSTTSTTSTTATGTTASAPADDSPVRTGGLILSPHTKPGDTDTHVYNPYSVLRTVEDIFGLSTLAEAKSAHGFDASVFTR